MDFLNLDPREVDLIFLSHCHDDHVGGLVGMLKSIGKEIPVVAHEDIFRPHLVMKPQLKHVGVGSNVRREVEKEGGNWILASEPIKLMEGILTTGEISVEEREPFERNTYKGLYTMREGGLVNDPLLDDTSLIARTPTGLVIISGCSHAGIVSIAKRSVKLTGEKKIRAIIGGFHLISAEQERIVKVISSLKGLEVEKIYTGHCTGLDAECMFRRELGNNFEKLQCGKIMEF